MCKNTKKGHTTVPSKKIIKESFNDVNNMRPIQSKKKETTTDQSTETNPSNDRPKSNQNPSDPEE